jgi:hypothetical protein
VVDDDESGELFAALFVFSQRTLYSCDVMNLDSRCPRCGTDRLRTWAELDDEQREVIRRLPASADYSLEERQARHRWCTRCWFEDTGNTPLNA